MLRTFLVVVIFSTLIVSNINLCEAKRLNHQIGKMKTCSIKCAPPFCRIKCIPTLTTTITPTTATSTIMTSTAITLTTMTSTTNTKADYTENQEVILLCFEMKLLLYYCYIFYFHNRKNQNILVYGCHLPIHMVNLNWSAFQN